jgi:glycosyltransferase involved in cell wall biosynthesis
MEHEALRIGHAARQYPEVRNIINCVRGASYHLCRDYYSVARKFGSLISVDPGSQRSFEDQFKFRDFGLNRVDCVHLFNGINYSRTPWVTTYETLIPRLREVLRLHSAAPQGVTWSKSTCHGVSLLAADNCKALIPLSESARQLQSRFLEHFPEHRETIEAKTRVVHPPQRPLISIDNQYQFPYEKNGWLTFMLVGHHFFRKGGAEVVDCLRDLKDRMGVDIRLVIVSKLLSGDYATDSGRSDEDRVRALIGQHSEWIEYHSVLHAQDVLEKMRGCDVGLLPSYAETYGYSVLEFQACARPVITTDIRAFPEINNADCGWTLPVDKKPVGGEAYFSSPEQRQALSCSIRSGLDEVIRSIVDDPGQIRRKGMKALERIQLSHSPEGYGEQMRSIYEMAL